MSLTDMVTEFHAAYGLPARDVPAIPSPQEQELRLDLLKEEFKEYVEAVEGGDLVETADALADMAYVIFGTALAYGIPLDRILSEVHRSNMSKLGSDGKPVYREDGKVLKGPNFEPPRIAEILLQQDEGI